MFDFLRNTNLQKLIFYVFFSLYSVLLIKGAMGLNTNQVFILFLVVSSLLTGYILISGKNIKFPPFFFEFVIFLIALLVHTYFTGGDFYFSALFATGSITWLISYNLDRLSQEIFINSITIYAIIFLGLGFILKSTGVAYILQNNLLLPLEASVNHNHLGDFWSVVIIINIYKYLNNKNKFHILLGIMGVVIVLLSFSRSAVLSVIVGTTVLYYDKLKNKSSNKIFYTFVAFLVLLVTFIGVFKTSLFSRPYFLQAFLVLFQNPWGVGIGNFNKFFSGAFYTHNQILEIMVGMGVFSLTYIYWLYKTTSDLLSKTRERIYLALICGVFINFMFDTTYTIPTMVWLFFCLLGLAQASEKESDNKKAKEL